MRYARHSHAFFKRSRNPQNRSCSFRVSHGFPTRNSPHCYGRTTRGTVPYDHNLTGDGGVRSNRRPQHRPQLRDGRLNRRTTTVRWSDGRRFQRGCRRRQNLSRANDPLTSTSEYHPKEITKTPTETIFEQTTKSPTEITQRYDFCARAYRPVGLLP